MWPWLESSLDVLQVVANVGVLIGGAFIWKQYVARLKAALTAKDAEITSVEKHRDMLRDRASELEKQSPEAMERVLSERISIRDKEIQNLIDDKSKHQNRLTTLEEERKKLLQDLARTQGFRAMLAMDGVYDSDDISSEAETGDAALGTGNSTELEVVLIGEIAVDSGQVLVTDPCYVDSEWRNEPFIPNRGGLASSTADTELNNADHDSPASAAYSYRGACEMTLSQGYGELVFKEGHTGAGVVLRTAWGDGSYPVYGEFHDGNIVRVYISAE